MKLQYESTNMLKLIIDKETKHHNPDVSETTSTYNCKAVLKLILHAAWQLFFCVAYLIQIINEFFLSESLKRLNLFFKALVTEPAVYLRAFFSS